MDQKEKEDRIIASLQRSSIQHPTGTFFCASTIYQGSKTFYALSDEESRPYLNEAFDILCRLEEENIVENRGRLPGPITPDNKAEFIAAAQWVLRKRE